MRCAFVAINAHYAHTSLALRQLRAHAPGCAYFEFHLNQPLRNMIDALVEYAPQLVGLSCYIWNVDMALRLARALKAALPDVRVAAGGPEVERDPAAYLRAHAELDFVLQGEGELGWPGLIAALDASGDARGCPGVWARARDSAAPASSGAPDETATVSADAPDETAPDLARGPELPLSAPEDWRFPYAPGELRALRDRLTYIETSRGCPFRCAYCLSRGQGVRMLDAERAAQWLIRMADEGARTIKLVDRTFNADDRRAIYIWDALIRRAPAWPQRPVFHFEITARLLSEAALDCLERAPAGLFQFEIGVQTTAPEALRQIDRPDDHSRIAHVVKRLKRRGNIHVHVDLIAGLPGETPRSLGQSFDDAWRMGADMVQLGFLKLLRGSELRARADALGLRYDPDPPYEIESTPTLPAPELIRARRIAALVDQYHNSGRYPCTLRLLTQGRSPWETFDALRRYWAAHGLYSHGLSPAERTAALYGFGLELGADPAWLSAVVRHDCIARGARLELPPSLASTLSDADRAALREYVRPVRGQWIERYAVDIAAYARGGPMRTAECAVLYDPARGAWFALDGSGQRLPQR